MYSNYSLMWYCSRLYQLYHWITELYKNIQYLVRMCLG
jgi:hypothetical protein